MKNKIFKFLLKPGIYLNNKIRFDEEECGDEEVTHNLKIEDLCKYCKTKYLDGLKYERQILFAWIFWAIVIIFLALIF